mmetsp:Transcript_16992/g.35101  ORF Transcript_16992/g.35101 Transcript_16992/m.35101 type:complete len:1224 (-) Transcript_16992:1144-4815(-)
MSLPPRVRSILTPTPLAASLSLAINGSATAVVTTATQNLTPTAMPKRSNGASSTVQKHVCMHVSKPIVVYLLEDPSSQSAQAHVSRRLVVQNIVTREILDSISLADLSYLIYRETDVNKIPQAVQSLGTIQSLDFYDPTTLHWSGMAVASTTEEGGHGRWETVVIQTTTRILFWNIRQGPNSHSVLHPSRKASLFKRLGAIIHETALGGNGAVPSSNLLPLSASTVLIGCSDGSLKSYNWHQKAVLKSIKGLGKGDWIVRLLSANRYTVNEGNSTKRRILTVTKKGICYLIELEIGKDSLDIKPPLARFVGGLAEVPSDSPMDHSTITYDAHRDLIFWLAFAPKTKQISMLVWNLNTLQSDLVQQVGSKNLFKPDPTLSIQIPSYCVEYSSAQALTTVFPVTHGAFSEDTVLLGSVSLATGDLHLIGASFHPTNTSSQVSGTTVMSADVAALIQQDGSLEFTPSLRIGAIRQSPLMAGSSHSLLLASNIGIILLELPTTSANLPGARHAHFGAGLGSLGKSILYVQDSSVIYGSLDVLVGNPTGRMQAKNTVTVYESPAAHNLPTEIQKRPFRSAPLFLPSPSGIFLCLFWPMEFRFEILHTASLLQKVGTRSGQVSQRSPVVASGHGVADFGWIGDDDVYALLHAIDFVEQATAFMVTPAAMEQASGDDTTNIRVSVKSVANLGRSVTKSAVSATSATLAVTKSATSATLAVTKSATSATLAATSAATKAAVNTTKKGMKRSIGLFGKKKKRGDDGGLSAMEAESEAATEDMSETTESNDPMHMAPIKVDMNQTNQRLQEAAARKRQIELRKLELVESNASALSASIAAATSSSLGEVTLRGGNRNVPTAVFGGPVLCVGSRTEDDPEGSAHFYAKKADSSGSRADEYVSTGPTLPYPDLVVWDDDGVLCAVMVENRVAIYALDSPKFVLLGNVRIPNPSNSFAPIYSAKFVHGVLYCCSSGSVHCVFLGDAESISQLECFELASIDVPVAGPIASLQQYKGFMPPSFPLPLVLPSVLGYQSGSLVVSTVRGLHAVPLTHPLLRIGTLLSAGQTDTAKKWFDAVPTFECEALSGFVERRGFPELAIEVSGISIERIVDLSMRHGFIGRLEEVVETYGVRGLRSIDAGRGLSPSLFGEHGGSVVVSVAAYLLAHGRIELARRMATECLRSGDEGRRDALLVASLLLSVDEHDASRLVGRAVEDVSMDWPVAQFIRHYILSERT